MLAQIYGVDSSFGGGFTLVIAVIAALLLAVIWAVLAGNRFTGAAGAERVDRIPHLYGYTVCLIALLWGLSSVVKITDNVVSLSAPEFRRGMEFGFEPSVTSFEAFRSSYDQARRMSMPYPPTAQLDSIPEAELRKRYEALRADRVTRGLYIARREIMTSSLSLLIAAALFAFHWRWLRRHPSSLPG